MCLKKRENIKFLISKVEEILVDILVSKFPEKMFSTYGNTMKQEFHGIYLKENRLAPLPTLSNQLSQQSLGLTDRRETKVSPGRVPFPSPPKFSLLHPTLKQAISSPAMMVRFQGSPYLI